MGLCRTCKREILRFQKERGRAASADYDRAFRLPPAILEEYVPKLEREERGDARNLEDLLALPREDRGGRVESAKPLGRCES